MSEKIKPSELSVKILEELDDLSSFDCSEDDKIGLNEFIHKEALDYQKELLGVTYLFFYNNIIVGFITIAMGIIEIKQVRYKLPYFVSFKEYPALVLGRIGVDNKYRMRDVGRSMCLWCLGKAQDFSKQVGCKFVVLLTEGENKIVFYKKCNFEIGLEYKNKKKVLMYQQIPLL